MAKSKTTLEPIDSRISNNNLIAGRLDHKDLAPVHFGFGTQFTNTFAVSDSYIVNLMAYLLTASSALLNKAAM